MSTWIEQKWQGIVRWHVSAYNAGGWGRLTLILVWFAVVAVIGTMNSEPLTSVEVHGEKAVIHKKILSSHLLESLAVQTLGEVYELAREHPDVNYVRVAFTMSKSGLIDKDGDPTKQDIQMGDLAWDAGALARQGGTQSERATAPMKCMLRCTWMRSNAWTVDTCCPTGRDRHFPSARPARNP